MPEPQQMCVNHPDDPLKIHDHSRQLCLICCLDRDVLSRSPVDGWDVIAFPMWLFETAETARAWIIGTNAHRCGHPFRSDEVRVLRARMLELGDGQPVPCWVIAAVQRCELDV